MMIQIHTCGLQASRLRSHQLCSSSLWQHAGPPSPSCGHGKHGVVQFSGWRNGSTALSASFVAGEANWTTYAGTGAISRQCQVASPQRTSRRTSRSRRHQGVGPAPARCTSDSSSPTKHASASTDSETAEAELHVVKANSGKSDPGKLDAESASKGVGTSVVAADDEEEEDDLVDYDDGEADADDDADEDVDVQAAWEEDQRQMELVDGDKERVFLIGVMLKRDRNKQGFTIDESLEELGRLADTAGLNVVGSSYQVLDSPNTATYIGSGKVEEIAAAVRNLGVDTVIFDDELSAMQLRNLERVFGKHNSVRVCDRTALILDIFSQRARTREGKLQVLLAQTEYQMPRVTRLWTHLERQSGGGQVKGMGEKQKEVDRRLLRTKISDLKKELQEVRRHREHYRNRRAATPMPVVALVGYTNAGKSTLLNTMTGAGVLAEDKLFATLDPTTRRIRLKGNQEVLLTDTVGFIQKLPTALVAAFRATLEEVQAATLLLHVLDVSHPNAKGQSAAVTQVLEEIKATAIPVITVWNKIDRHPHPEELREQAAILEHTVCLSGLTGEGLEELQETIATYLEESMLEMDLLLPYSAGDLLDSIHKAGQVKSCEYTPHGTLVTACVPKALAGRLQEFSILPQPPQEEEDEQPWLKLPAAAPTVKA